MRTVRSGLPPVVSLLVLVVLAIPTACGEAPGSGTTPQRSEADERAPVSDPPGFADFEPAVREQFEERRSAVRRLEADPSASRDARAEAWGELGLWHLAYQHLVPGKEALEEARRLAPRDLRWPYYLGQLARIQGDLSVARAHLDRVLELRPGDVPTRVWLGELELEAGDLDGATAHFDAVLAEEPDHPRALLGRGKIALSRGDSAAAVTALERVAVLAPEATEWRYPLGRALRMEGEAERSAELLEAATLSPEERVDVPLVDPLTVVVESIRIDERRLEDRARRLAAEGRWEEALEILPENPSTPETLDTAFTLRYRAGRLESACRAARQLAEVRPGSPRAALYLGICAGEAGDVATAERRYREALATDRGSEGARSRLANLLVATDRPEEAVDHYRLWIDAAPADSSARYGLAAALLQTGRWSEAGEVLDRARRDFPGSGEIAFLLARLRAAAPDPEERAPEAALELAREAWSTRRDLARAETVAMAFAAAGRFAEAERWQTAARRAVEARGAEAPWVADRQESYRSGRSPERPWDSRERFLPIPVEPPGGV